MIAHGVQALDILLQQSILAQNPILYQFLKLFQLNPHYDIVDLIALFVLLLVLIIGFLKVIDVF